jgi:hypothetical protein
MLQTSCEDISTSYQNLSFRSIYTSDFGILYEAIRSRQLGTMRVLNWKKGSTSPRPSLPTKS